MAFKLPKDVLRELDKLIERLSGHDPEERKYALSRLVSYEKSGKIPLDALLELAGEDNPSLVTYGITGLGRNGSSRAVAKLLELLTEHRSGNVIMMEYIIDALGESGDKSAAPAVLALIGIDSGWKNSILGRFFRKNEGQDQKAQERSQQMLLPVVRAVEKFSDKKSAKAVGILLEAQDSLVRWHAIQAIVNGGVTDYIDNLKKISESDANEMVREAAQIALGKLAPLPQHLNN